ncbi:hypothetical protein BIFCAT_00239 [Bifidobacterium catenulatum DSM 16992 = JCM 1194 = LMG 11043]|uniref:Uncharacterized protein n=1 Tax=Bifidobacterium catenulatum DSM 16992 = JCM 1194 = LMG 11043 TaxID=566552 RepID=B6XST2_9BIFI|nr:hypothetical protein BIFCAT_00239 [Bifidobacterium catenulatum DSM 16992 = JCM 1194 = LMG 11043]
MADRFFSCAFYATENTNRNRMHPVQKRKSRRRERPPAEREKREEGFSYGVLREPRQLP